MACQKVLRKEITEQELARIQVFDDDCVARSLSANNWWSAVYARADDAAVHASRLPLIRYAARGHSSFERSAAFRNCRWRTS
jgi:hypothetical protein